jgi:serine/threonine protein phosphatase PrpC
MAGAEEYRIRFAALSHRGFVRKNNEDRLGTYQFTIPGKNKTPALLAVLADGVGGNKGGEVAAQIAVDTIVSNVRENTSLEDPHAALKMAVDRANQAIFSESEGKPELNNMATTCVCALVIGKRLYAAHLGDSRLYLLRKRGLRLLTSDHTWTVELGGVISSYPDGIPPRSHPLAHVLSRYLGAPQSCEVDLLMDSDEAGKKISFLDLAADDTLLLCSDGLTDMLPEAEIAKILQTCTFHKSAQSLVYRALQNGGHDNTTVIVINIPT